MIMIYKYSSNQQIVCNIFFPSSWVGYSQPGFEGQQHILEEGEYLDYNDWGGSEQLLSLRPILSVSTGKTYILYIIITRINCGIIDVYSKLWFDHHESVRIRIQKWKWLLVQMSYSCKSIQSKTFH